MNSKNKIRGYRNMLGMTQKQLGEKLGMTKQSYHNKETGRNSFSDSEKIAFKQLLLPMFPEITIEDIFF
ncbi:helix-turn-helix transcriptional regulator [Streptococcus caballi]|uniref:helix-turn-helix transcriptional regulator n=1 Tax=Streptococcus caballi TaxID=439220 RepID=UPI0003699D62|nr:helix-turn-helix domain-containing protein [Streptococcus caballi]QBX13495.1 transcriptional regulator [Streptococcus satellite phage Javan86]